MGRYASTSHSKASVSEVKNLVGHGGFMMPRKKLAMTLSTGDEPQRAIREAWQGLANTDRAPLVTSSVVAMSTIMGCRSEPQSSLTLSMALWASASLIRAPRGQVRRRIPGSSSSSSNVTCWWSCGVAGWSTILLALSINGCGGNPDGPPRSLPQGCRIRESK